MYQRKLNTQTPETETGGNKLKIIIISSLAALFIILFYFYVTFSSDENETVNEIVKSKPVSKEELSKDIDSVLFTFGINKDWIKENISKNKSDEFRISKVVGIPADLQTIELNYELTNYFRSKTLKDKAVEDPKTKNLLIEIFSMEDTVKRNVGNIKLIYTDTLKRNAADVCIVLDSIEYHSLTDIQEILSFAESYSLFLPLRNDKADYQSVILEAKKDYLIEFIVGDENEVIADFKSDMKESTWKSKVKTAAMNYPDAAGVILRFSSDVTEFADNVKEEFVKNNVTVYKDTVFTSFKISAQKVNSLIENITSNSGKDKKNLIYSVNFDINEFKEFEQKAYQLKKLGYRFFDFSDIMKKINKELIKPPSK